MITVAVVNHGDYLSRGQQYTDTMRAMVARNLSEPHEFVCLKDVGPHRGWWSKVELFRPGRFTGRVLYLDLDSVVVGALDELAATKGTIDLADWGWPTHTLCSSVMVWDAGEHAEIFAGFTRSATLPGKVMRRFRGDQDWITHLGGWDALPAHLCRSYRYDCKKAPPPGCVHVSMHGQTKPHEITTGWVPEKWKIE